MSTAAIRVEFVGGPWCGLILKLEATPGRIWVDDNKRVFSRPKPGRHPYKVTDTLRERDRAGQTYLYAMGQVICEGCGAACSVTDFDGEPVEQCLLCGNALAA